MGNNFAKIISVIFQPLFMPTYTLLLVFNINMYFSAILPFFAKLLLLIMIFSSTVLIPVIIFTVFKRKGLIRSYHMETKEERNYPYVVTAIIYFLMYMLILQTAVPAIYSFFLLCATTLSLLLLIINFRFKISAHMAGIGGVCGLLIGLAFRLNLDLTFQIIAAIACAGLVGYARLKLNSHKPSEVYLGFLAGVSVFLGFALLL
ncbi:MAG TPA: hypothetical protein PKI01_06280 [Bacteroidales bacterium]|nr:hypothetical protein [Bacteroidales bacterium]